MQRFGVEIHNINKDLILLTFKRKNAYEKENDFITLVDNNFISWVFPRFPKDRNWDRI